MPKPPEDVTELLKAVFDGNESAGKRLFTAVYNELHRLAHGAMRRERPNHTLQTTALVHEAYLRLVKDEEEHWENRAHFFTTAATAMRRILVDHARGRKAAKRGHGKPLVSLDELRESDQGTDETRDPLEELEALDKALDKLGSQTPHRRKCTVVELRYFVGLTLEQTAEVLKVSMATIKRDWEFTKAWLRREMNRDLKGTQGNA